MPQLFTTCEMADLLGSEEWRVRRLFESGALPEPDRLAGIRVLSQTMIPEIMDALRARNWLPVSEVFHG